MKPKYWLILGLFTACAAESTACSSSFKSCNDSRTCVPTAGNGGRHEAGDKGSEAGTPDELPSGGKAGESGELGGEGGDTNVVPADAGASGSAGDGAVICGADVDLKMDPKNCGTCGHDCVGGECDLGQCLPFTIVPADGYINDYVVVGEYVYWSGCNAAYTECFVARRRIDGSGAVKVLVPDEGGSLAGLGASASQLLWPAKDHVRVCELPDCPNGAEDIVAAPNATFATVHFAAASQTIFWSGISKKSTKGGLNAFSLSASAAVEVGSPSADTRSITSDEKYVYWCDQSSVNGDTRNADGAIWRASLKDLSPTLLAASLSGSGGALTLGADAVFFAGKYESKGASGLSSAIFRIPLPNGVGAGALPIFFNLGLDGGAAPLVIGQSLYWADNFGLIQRCPLSGCTSPEIVASGKGASHLKQDSNSLYWLGMESNFAKVVRVIR